MGRLPAPGRPGRRGVLATAWLLGLLLGPALRLAAQELVPGTYDPSLENIYPRPLAETYRRQRVRAVLVTRQAIDRRAAGQPLVSTPLSYQEYDAQGRLTRRYMQQGGLLAIRFDFTYGPSGGDYTSYTRYNRLADPADTTRLGRVWLPDTYTAYPPATDGTGLAAQWDERTGDWLLTKRYRRWLRHDTTYLATTLGNLPYVRTLTRSYPVGRGKTMQREDELTFTSRELREATYTYLKLDKDRILELGELHFETEYGSLPGAGPNHRYGPLAPRDEIARHAKGQAQPSVVQTFDAHGEVASREVVELGVRTVYERTASGQLQQCRHYRGGQLWQDARFGYLASGLVARVSAFEKENEQSSALLYSYRYY